jgi:pSer/pThr/pTyr-binding forkhead associated (FHA) protein
MIGRSPDSTIVVADPRASRRHAEIRPSGHGFVVNDLGSMNGTVVNGAAVREHVLQDGDEVRIGSTTLRFEES